MVSGERMGRSTEVKASRCKAKADYIINRWAVMSAITDESARWSVAYRIMPPRALAYHQKFNIPFKENFMKSKIAAVLLCFVAVSIVGCSGERRPDGFPPLYSASVRIVQDGTPLEGATVFLFPTDGTSPKWGTMGFTDSNGKAVLATHGKFSGAPEGEYLVIVEKKENVTSPHRGDGTAVESFLLVEQQYGNKETTPLKIQIQKRGQNHEEFDVGKPVRISLGREVAQARFVTTIAVGLVWYCAHQTGCSYQT